jgi:hypothetical protein
MLYKTLASKFDHQAVIFSILPDNDFKDDRPPAAGHAAGPYRPFLAGEYPRYELRYTAGDYWERRLQQVPMEAFLNEFWLTFRARHEIGGLLKDRTAQLSQRSQDRHSRARAHGSAGYFDYDRAEFNRLRFAIEQIKTIAGGRPMLVFTVPRPRDFWRAAESVGAPPLRRDLEQLSSTLGVTYIDFLERMQADDWRRYFFTCDGHWSREGHQAAAAILSAWQFYRTPR